MQKGILMLLLLFTVQTTNAQAPAIGFQTIATGLSEPITVVNAADGTNRLFIVEKTGAIKIFNGTNILSTPFLNIAPKISAIGERGLLSLAFHPQYNTNRFFYLYYTNTQGSIVVERYQTKTTNANEADTSTGAILLTITKSFANHNGGTIAFGKDSMLYISTGDGGSGGDPENNAQNPNSLLGKMLRLQVTTNAVAPYYTIPTNNPYIGVSGFRAEIVALGLRNPFRWSFDKLTGDMWIGDVGQGAWEEINFRSFATLTMPTNYGWRCFEGNNFYTTCLPQTPANNIFPVFEYDHTTQNGGFSVTGGHVYRGTEYSFLQGYYLCSDYITNNGWLIKANGSGGFTTVKQSNWLANIAGYGEAENGTLYAVSLNGTFAKVTAAETLPISLLQFSATNNNAVHTLQWQVLDEQLNDKYIIQQSINNSNFSAIDSVYVTTNRTSNSYTKKYSAIGNSITRYRIQVKNNNGSIFYSSVIELRDAPAIINIKKSLSSVLQISANQAIMQIAVYSTNGKQLLQKIVQGNQANINLPVNTASIYLVKVWLQNGNSYNYTIL